MGRDEILAVVRKHIVEARDGLSPEAVDPALSMVDLGLGSLDIVEVVSRSMRELKVKVPRPELRKLTTINGLVDLLHQAASAKAPAAPGA